MPEHDSRAVYFVMDHSEAEVLHPEAADICERLALQRVFPKTELSKYTHALVHAGYKVFCVRRSKL